MNFNTQYYIDRQKYFLDQVDRLQSSLREKRSLEYEIENLLEQLNFNQMILRSDLNDFIANQQTGNSSASQQ